MKKYNAYIYLLPWFICTLGALFYAYEYFLRISPSVMSADLIKFYNLTDAGLGNLSACYYYIYTPMQLVAGVLMDRYGPRRLLTIATLCCVIGSFLFAGTQYLLVAQIGRVFVGFGSAFAFVGVLKLATIWLPRRYFAMFSGMATALGMLGAVFGDLVLTHFVQMLGWQETVFISAIFGIGLALLIGLFVRDQALDKKGHYIQTQHVNLSQVIYALIKIIKMPQMWVVGIIGGLMYIPASTFAELWGIPYLEQARGFSADQAALANSMVFIGWAIGGPIVGWISDTIKRRNLPMGLGSLLSALFILVVLFLPDLNEFDVSILLFGFGMFASAQVIVFAVGKEFNPMKYAGSAIAFVNMAVMLFGAIMQPLEGELLDRLTRLTVKPGWFSGTPQPNYELALLLIPIALFIAAFLVTLLLRETNCHPVDGGVAARFRK